MARGWAIAVRFIEWVAPYRNRERGQTCLVATDRIARGLRFSMWSAMGPLSVVFRRRGVSMRRVSSCRASLAADWVGLPLGNRRTALDSRQAPATRDQVRPRDPRAGQRSRPPPADAAGVHRRKVIGHER